MSEGFNELISLRSMCLSSANQYVFGTANSSSDEESSHIRATDVMRRFSEDCGAVNSKNNLSNSPKTAP